MCICIQRTSGSRGRRFHRRLTNVHVPQLRGNRRKWYEFHIAPQTILTPLAQSLMRVGNALNANTRLHLRKWPTKVPFGTGKRHVVHCQGTNSGDQCLVRCAAAIVDLARASLVQPD